MARAACDASACALGCICPITVIVSTVRHGSSSSSLSPSTLDRVRLRASTWGVPSIGAAVESAECGKEAGRAFGGSGAAPPGRPPRASRGSSLAPYLSGGWNGVG
eukprot:5105221-Prymnesium_polylepis.1